MSREWRWSWPRASAALGLVVFGVATAEFILAVRIADPAGGANIGAGIGMMAMISSGLATCGPLFVERARSATVQVVTGITAALLLTWSAFGILLLGLGIAEEMNR